MNESCFCATHIIFTVWKQTQKKSFLFFCVCLTNISRDSSNMVTQKDTSDSLNQSFHGTKIFIFCANNESIQNECLFDDFDNFSCDAM